MLPVLTRFRPAEANPLFLIDRRQEISDLKAQIHGFLHDSVPKATSLCVNGPKGVGKTIFTRKALYDPWPSGLPPTLFLEVDCRVQRNRREVFRAVAAAALVQLGVMKGQGIAVSPALLDTARVLDHVTRFDSAELRVVQESLEQYRAAVELKGKQSLLSALGLHFNISLERSVKLLKDMTGRVTFDESLICKLLKAFFADLLEQGIRVVLFLDNVDELNHSYTSAEVLDRTRADVEGILLLHSAPICLVINMRSYFCGVLPREITYVISLPPLPPEEMATMLNTRISDQMQAWSLEDQQQVAAVLSSEKGKQAVAAMVKMAPTPLSFLIWFQYVYRTEASLGAGLDLLVNSLYAGLKRPQLARVAAAFPDPNAVISQKQLLTACGDDERLMARVQDRQVVLPDDFWHPVEFTLDPQLHFLHPAYQELSSDGPVTI